MVPPTPDHQLVNSLEKHAAIPEDYSSLLPSDTATLKDIIDFVIPPVSERRILTPDVPSSLSNFPAYLDPSSACTILLKLPTAGGSAEVKNKLARNGHVRDHVTAKPTPPQGGMVTTEEKKRVLIVDLIVAGFEPSFREYIYVRQVGRKDKYTIQC
ncbi:uncharacterized protein EV420DRAFT_1485194 [Desarmillaria tabescens]|uniref:Uncharacterized protein n=1 Tax=Armillaria tabescens TaxID=1929756 RepID=A0AA39MQY0_ARMTA|nr:uncharacterized protein EV420DRAFT_1485194 [Desarmillaria tabescens]KAK0442774.1 hypothetical protein EV420DRAFT_1485194 [Desarmillaria tabescens]